MCPDLNGHAQGELRNRYASLWGDLSGSWAGPFIQYIAVFVNSHASRVRQVTYMSDTGQS